MTERAAHLVTEVLPRAPVRQWVLSLPYRLRYQLAWDHELCRAVLGVFARTLLDFYRRRGTADGRTGTLTVIQRFGGGLNLNVHFHTLALDGVFTEPVPGGPLVFLVHRVEQEQASVRALQTRHLFPLEDTQPARRRAVEVGLHRRRDRARAEERLARVAVGEARVRQIHPARRVEPAGRGGR